MSTAGRLPRRQSACTAHVSCTLDRCTWSVPSIATEPLPLLSASVRSTTVTYGRASANIQRMPYRLDVAHPDNLSASPGQRGAVLPKALRSPMPGTAEPPLLSPHPGQHRTPINYHFFTVTSDNAFHPAIPICPGSPGSPTGTTAC